MTPTHRVPECWKVPPTECLKLNIDAQFHELLGQGGTGLVVCDHTGKLIRSQARWYEHINSARMMEAMAMLDVVVLASDMGWRRILVESDAFDVVNLWESRDFARADIAKPLQEIKELCGNFISLSISFVRREANTAAHLSAKQASEVRRRCLWINFIPEFLHDVIARECITHE